MSLPGESESYAIPISYGYDTNKRRFYLRLVSTPESEKRQFLGSAPRARLVVYEEADPLYWSVIAVGTLREIALNELTVEHIEQFGQAKRPLFEIWPELKPDLHVTLYQLLPDEISDRRIEIDRSETNQLQ